NDITQIQQVMMIILRMVLRAPLMIIGGIVMAVSKDAKLSLVLLGVMPYLLGALLFIFRKIMSLFQAVQKRLDTLNLVMRDDLAGYRVIRALNKETTETNRLKTANENFTNNLISVNKLMAFLMPLMMLLMNLTVVAIIWLG